MYLAQLFPVDNQAYIQEDWVQDAAKWDSTQAEQPLVLLLQVLLRMRRPYYEFELATVIDMELS